MQSTSRPDHNAHDRLHVGIIMDGNGRWATRRGLSRLRGHEAGVEAIRRVVEAAPEAGRRHADALRLLDRQLAPAQGGGRGADGAAALLSRQRGREPGAQRRPPHRDRPPRPAARRHRRPRSRAPKRRPPTATTLHLRIAVDYSARDAILNAAAKARRRWRSLTREAFSDSSPAKRACAMSTSSSAPRGEKRLSDFLLWEGAYAELHFTERMWPEFDAEDLATRSPPSTAASAASAASAALPLEPAPSL